MAVQPNFVKAAAPGGLYEQRLGSGRGRATNCYRDLLDVGAPLAIGLDGMPLDPLAEINWVVSHPTADQQRTVTEALRAYTLDSAAVGFDDD